ncbi:unnamed protein product, partial [Ectocarpus sp. 4 AP-2014]
FGLRRRGRCGVWGGGRGGVASKGYRGQYAPLLPPQRSAHPAHAAGHPCRENIARAKGSALSWSEARGGPRRRP